MRQHLMSSGFFEVQLAEQPEEEPGCVSASEAVCWPGLAWNLWVTWPTSPPTSTSTLQVSVNHGRLSGSL